MKKTLLILSALCTAMFGASATELSIQPAVEIVAPNVAHHPVLSPDGSKLLFSTQDHSGLYSFDMQSKTVSLLDEGLAAGFEPVFSADSKTVFYQTATMEDGLLVRDVRRAKISDGKVKQLKKASREDENVNKYASNTYVTTTLKSIVIVIDGKKTEIAPIEDAHSYLWPSLSPDGKRVLFNEPFKGVFYCNLDGTGLTKVASRGDYPCWLSDDVVLAVDTRDDGYVVTSSVLHLYDLIGLSSATLTQDDTKVAELTTCPATGDVVYSTIEGKLYRTNIKIIR